MNEYNHGLVFKWLKSENCSSKESKRLAKKTREAFNLTAREYRKMLSYGRRKTRILERLMSLNQWDKIDFSKIPSKAGLKYKKCFANKDIIKKQYENFAKDKTTKVNAAALYPHEVVEKALHCRYSLMDDTDRLMVNKYWENLPNWVKNANFNGICVVDTSGSMFGTPINVAISLGLYCAERAGGPFANHYISFASRPQLIETKGADFVDKVRRIYETNLVDNTNIEAVFELLLNTAIQNNCSQEEIPQNVVIVSDMEFDAAAHSAGGYNWYRNGAPNPAYNLNRNNVETVMEGVARKWAQHGYKMPHIVYWNCDARSDNIPMLGNGPISYVSGFSPSIFQTILTGKTGFDLMMEALNSERYSVIH